MGQVTWPWMLLVLSLLWRVGLVDGLKDSRKVVVTQGPPDSLCFSPDRVGTCFCLRVGARATKGLGDGVVGRRPRARMHLQKVRCRRVPGCEAPGWELVGGAWGEAVAPLHLTSTPRFGAGVGTGLWMWGWVLKACLRPRGVETPERGGGVWGARPTWGGAPAAAGSAVRTRSAPVAAAPSTPVALRGSQVVPGPLRLGARSAPPLPLRAA